MLGRIYSRRCFVVYQLPSIWHRNSDISYKCSFLDQNRVQYFFRNDSVRVKTFRRFLSQGFRGIVWYVSDEWISYAWISSPETLGPLHLPHWIRKLPVYWIFYCRTREEYQGQGLFKASIILLAQWARNREPDAEVYIDTSPDNIPSRRAINSVGFVPAGIITTWTLNLPKVHLILSGKWDKEAPHPGTPKETNA